MVIARTKAVRIAFVLLLLFFPALAANAAPSITSLSPTSGPVGTLVTITGSNFGSTQGTSTVTFNGTTATTIVSWGTGTIKANVPAAATTGNVVVTVGGVASNGKSFTVTPHISSLSPTSGAVGATVTITGTTFGSTQGTSTVKFNGKTATATNWTSTSITVTVPSGATNGNVVVTVSSQASNGVSFTVLPAPNITSLSQPSGIVGTSITITGTNFGSTQGSGNVTFNGTTATVSSWASSSIGVTVPSGATTGNVVVYASGVNSNGVSFTVLPQITSLSPNSGAVGASVTISGTTFGSTQGSSTVKFNGTAATATNWSSTSIAVTVPAGATTGNVLVTVSNQASNGVNFTVLPTPTITSLSTTSAAIGTSVTVTGTNFGAAQGSGTVKFNGTTATVSSWSATSIAVTVPSGATTGNVIVNASGVNTNGVNFTVLPTPNITSLSATSGAVGSTVTISGANFGSSQGNGTVSFNGTTASVMSWTASSIATRVPSGATNGNVVVNASGVASNGIGFTVLGLPSGWSDSDVGPSGAAGSASYGNDVYTVKSAGNGVGYGNGNNVTIDGFHFVYQQFSGDGSILARVSSLQGGWDGQAGVMIRETLDQSATNAFLNVQTLSTPYLYWWNRTSTGGNETSPNSNSLSGLPVWIKLVRQGNNFTAYTAPDGINWQQFGSTVTINMAQTVYVGLVCTGGDNGATLATAALDSVTVGSVQSPAPSISTVSATTGPIGSQVVLSGSGFGTSQGGGLVTLNTVPVTTNSWSANSITITIPTGATSGHLVVSVAPSMNDSSPVEFTVTGNPLPSGWLDWDIGPAGAPGTATYSGGIFTLTSAGTGVAGVNGSSTTVDGLHFVYQALPADGEIVARLKTLQGGWAAQAGLMIRETLDEGATNMFLADTSLSSPSLYLNTRTTSNANETGAAYSTISLPIWLKVIRSGSTFAAYTSADGINWTQFGSNVGISMVNTVYVGIASTGGNNGTNASTSTFDYVSVATSLTPAPLIGGLSATTGAIGTQIILSGSGFGATQGSGSVTLNGIAVTVNSWSASSITITIPAGATSGLLAVTVAPSMNCSNVMPFEVTTNPLPNGWLDQDIGAVGVSGGATYSNNTFTVQGAGYGVGGTSYGFGGPQDSFHFVYATLTGDGAIVARVVSEPGSTGQAGVLFRQTIEDVSPLNAFVSYFPQNTDVYFWDRTSEGASESILANTATVSLPYWVKLVRSGNTFSAFASADATNWVQVGTSQTVAMSTAAYAGLAVTSHSTASLATITFDNVSVGTTQNPAPTITSVSSTTGSIGSQVIISGSGFGYSQGTSQVLLNNAPTTVNSWNQSSITITIPAGATSGALVVSVAPNMDDSNAVQFTVTSNPLPSGWFDQDVGLVGVVGNATYSSGTFTINGGGWGVGGTGGGYGGTQDSFHFVYQPLAGNGTIIARIVTNPGTMGQAGIMIRQSLDTGSLNAFLANFPQNGGAYVFERASTGSVESIPANGAGTMPYWVKLVRNGATFTCFTSTDGSTWTQVGSGLSIPMGQNVYVGLGVSGGTTSSLGSATFDNVSTSFSGWGASPTISTLSPTSGSFGTSVTISGSNFGATQGTSTVTFNGTAATVTGWGVNSITVNVPSGATTGNALVTVGGIASNGVNFGVFNPVVSSVAPPAAQQGAMVTISGSGFGGTPYGNQVQFNGVQSPFISSWSNTSITAQVPTNATSGPLVVIEGGVTSNSFQFSVETLGITTISPTFASANAQVTIHGTGFGSSASNSVVYFNGTTASIQSWSDTQIVALVPVGANSGPVSVTVGSVTWYGPVFYVTNSVQLTNSQSNQTSYTSAIIGGMWVPLTSQGPGCSSCNMSGNISYTYDASGRALTRTDQNGNASTYTYDANGNVLTVTVPITSGHTATTTYTYNGFGEALTMTDPLGNVTSYSYDAKGNLLSVTAPAPGNGASTSVTQFAYNSFGELVRITDPLGNQTNVAYFPTGLIQTITDTQNNVTTYAYDSRGNRTSVTDANNKQTTFTYDAMNRLTKITYPDTTTTQFGYDVRGRRTSVTDQNNKTTAYVYDDADRLTSVTDAGNNVTTYGYDTESNLTSLKDANNNTTTFYPDTFGRVYQTTFPSGYIETYGYDNVGNLTSKTDRKNQQITYTYDQLNRLTKKTYPDTSTVNYTLDDDSRLTQVTDPTGTYSFTFDNMGRVTGTTTNYTFLTGRTFTTSYGYDGASNRTSFVDPENGSTSYGYDTLNRLQTLTPPAAISGGNFGFGYDALNRRTSLTRPNAVNTAYSYDNLSRLLSVTHAKSGTTLDGATYTVDNAGNRLTRTPQPTGTGSTFGYDNLYELLSVTQGSTTTEGYTYDAVGNRLTSLGSAMWGYNTSNELNSRPTYSYTYDMNGNTQTTVNSSGTTTYTWDYENRMVSAVLPGSGGTVYFKYDPFGRRIYKSSLSGTSIYAYDGDNLIEETNSSGTAVARYTQGLNIDEPLAMLRNGTTSYYQADGLGSLTSLSNTSGALANTYTYDSFGNLTASTGSSTNAFRYTGREFDTETGLYYYRARYYDPQTGRFSREDPLGFYGGDVNFYRYVWNHPTSLRDPRGLWGAGVVGSAGAFGGLGGDLSGGATVTVGGAYFLDSSAPLGFTSGGFISGGAFGAGHGVFGNPNRCSSSHLAGGNRGAGVGAGIGGGLMMTNGNSVDDLAGPFDNTTVLLPFMSVDLGEGAHGVKTLTVTWGPGWGLGIFHYVTNTYTNPVSNASFCGCDK